MGQVHFSHFFFFLLFVSQPEWKNEMNQISSKLKKDSLQDGKHTMGVSTHPSGTIRQRKCWRNAHINGQLLFVGRPCAVLHNDLVFHPWSSRPSHSIMWQIPRIILTHPSTSDEDVELLTQSPSTEQPHDFDIPGRCVCFDSAFYLPWPQPWTRILQILSRFCFCLLFFCNAMLCQVIQC